MAIAISDAHRELGAVARSFLENDKARAASRALLDAPDEALPPFWDELAELGWLGLHIPEEFGGSGYGLSELVVVLEELGRAVAPGRSSRTVIASTLIDRAGDDAQRARLLPALVDGSRAGAGRARRLVAARCRRQPVGDGGLVLGAGLADVFVLARATTWSSSSRAAAGVETSVQPGTRPDPSRRPRSRSRASRSSRARSCAARSRSRSRWRGPSPPPRPRAVRRSASRRATAYAKERQQFGRPIAMFQAVKHHCANMLVAAELATAAVWDAGRAANGDADALRARRRRRGHARPARVLPERAAQHPGARRHRLHLGARRPHAAAPRDRARRAVRRRGRGRDGHPLFAGRCHPRPRFRAPARGRGVPRGDPCRGRRARRARRRRPARAVDRHRLRPAALAQAVGPRRAGARTARHRRGVRPRGVAPPAVRHHRLDHPHAHPARHRGPDRALGAAHARAHVHVVPALQRARRRLRRRRHPHARRPVSTAAGRSPVRRCGRAAPSTANAGSPPCAPTPTRRSTTASPPWSSTCRPKASRCVRLREATGAAMFNEVFFDHVFVPDDDVVGAVDNGWEVAALDARQRAGEHRWRRRRGVDRRRPRPAAPVTAVTTTCDAGWASTWPRARRCGRSTCGASSARSPAASRGPRATSPSCSRREHAQRAADLALAARRPGGGVRRRRRPGGRSRGDLHPGPLDRRRHVGDHPQPDRRAHPRAPPRPADQLVGVAGLSTELVDARDSPSAPDDVGRDAHFRCAKETRRAGTEVHLEREPLDTRQ